jgi:hypothetical protein
MEQSICYGYAEEEFEGESLLPTAVASRRLETLKGF